MDESSDLRSEAEERQIVLRQLIRDGVASTQEEFSIALKQKKYDVTQSTISRDLRRIGAIKITRPDGEATYKLPDDHQVTLPLDVSDTLGGLLISIDCNDSLVVMHTAPGSASLVARHLDTMRAQLGFLGTIAGDDTIFIAPQSKKKIPSLVKKIKDEFY